MNVPTNGAPAYSTWTGRTAAATHPEAAKVLLNRFASKPGQTAMLVDGGDYSVRDDVAPPAANRTPMPSPQDAELVHPETYPEYITDRDSYQA